MAGSWRIHLLLALLLLSQRADPACGQAPRLSLEGWLEQGFSWNPAQPADRFNGPVLQNDRANEYQLNQLYLTAARPADTESGSLSLGFQTDWLYGTDAFFYQALGLDDHFVSDRVSRFYKLTIPQLYAELYAPIGRGITVQFGKWYALVGYETGLATGDFFYSKTIGFNPTPYSHTGILATFELSDRLSTSHGLHRGSDVWEDNNNNLGYTASVTWQHDEANSLYFAINTGPEQDERADFQDLDGSPGPDAPGENLNRFIYSLTYERQISDRWSYVMNHDYFFQAGSQKYSIQQAEAYGVAQYLTYQHHEQLAAGLRLEIYRDDDGFVGSGFRSENEAAAGVYTNLTCGLQIRPRSCLLVRPEIRWDWQHRDDEADTPAFDSGTSDHQFLFSTDAVIRF